MIDLDGTYDYSSIIKVNSDCGDDEMYIFPNPVGKDISILNVHLKSDQSEVEIVITDMLGRTVKRLLLGVEPNEVNKLIIDIDDLSEGTYNLSTLKEGEINQSKIFIILSDK